MHGVNIYQHCLHHQINQLVKTALVFFSTVDYIITGHLVDLRHGLVYLSLIGMAANYQERQTFIEIDRERGHRKRLLNLLRQRATQLRIVDLVSILEGGSVGIAIYPIEWDKVQVLEHLSSYQSICYFGDKYLPGENDYRMITDPRVTGFKVNSPEATIASDVEKRPLVRS